MFLEEADNLRRMSRFPTSVHTHIKKDMFILGCVTDQERKRGEGKSVMSVKDRSKHHRCGCLSICSGVNDANVYRRRRRWDGQIRRGHWFREECLVSHDSSFEVSRMICVVALFCAFCSRYMNISNQELEPWSGVDVRTRVEYITKVALMTFCCLS